VAEGVGFSAPRRLPTSSTRSSRPRAIRPRIAGLLRAHRRLERLRPGRSSGGTILAKGGDGYKFNSPELKASFDLFQRMYKEGIVKKIAEAYGDQTDFGNYRVLFAMGSTSGLPFFDDAVKKARTGRSTGASRPFRTPRPSLWSTSTGRA